MEEKQAVLENRGAATGTPVQGFLDAIQHKISKPSDFPSNVGPDTFLTDETWRQTLFSSPKRRLQARWESLSPSLKERLKKYSPKKLREFFEESEAKENDAEMEECGRVSMGGSKMLAERQSRYKQIAAFYLDTPREQTHEPLLSYQTDTYVYDDHPHSSQVTSTPETEKANQFSACAGPIYQEEELYLTASLIDKNSVLTISDNTNDCSSNQSEIQCANKRDDLLVFKDTDADELRTKEKGLTVGYSLSHDSGSYCVTTEVKDNSNDSIIQSTDHLASSLDHDVVVAEASVALAYCPSLATRNSRDHLSLLPDDVVQVGATILGDNIKPDDHSPEVEGQLTQKIKSISTESTHVLTEHNISLFEVSPVKTIDYFTTSLVVEKPNPINNKRTSLDSANGIDREDSGFKVNAPEEINKAGYKVKSRLVASERLGESSNSTRQPDTELNVSEIDGRLKESSARVVVPETRGNINVNVERVNLTSSNTNVSDTVNLCPRTIGSDKEVTLEDTNNTVDSSTIYDFESSCWPTSTDYDIEKGNVNIPSKIEIHDPELNSVPTSHVAKKEAVSVPTGIPSVVITSNKKLLDSDIDGHAIGSSSINSQPLSQGIDVDLISDIECPVSITNCVDNISSTNSCEKDLISKDSVEESTSKMPVGMPHIVLQSPDMTLHRPNTLTTDSLSPSDIDAMQKRKSPLTVQEWVDHLPSKPKILDDKMDDPPELTSTLRCSAASRLSREASVQSSSSLDSLLDSRRPDPVEVLLNLGFGGVPGIDLENCRIPKRFLQPSKCKGGDWDEFLRRELLQVQNFECAALGFRGLSGPSHQRPSAIVANIMEKLRERSGPRPPARGRFTSVARRVLSETSVLSKLSPLSQQSSANSVLTPDNRKFLESQGKISPEVPRRRIIFGQKSFAFDKDGELVEVEQNQNSTVSASSWSAESDSEDGKMELQPSATDLLRMRRSSLQRQRKIEEDDDEPSEMKNPRRRCASVSSLQHVPENYADIRDELVAEIQTLTRKIKHAPREELAAILEPIKELRVKLDEL